MLLCKNCDKCEKLIYQRILKSGRHIKFIYCKGNRNIIESYKWTVDINKKRPEIYTTRRIDGNHRQITYFFYRGKNEVISPVDDNLLNFSLDNLERLTKSQLMQKYTWGASKFPGVSVKNIKTEHGNCLKCMFYREIFKTNKFNKLIDGAKTKKNMKFYRRQRKLYISKEDLERGETILPSVRSVSISKEGANDYVGRAKSYKYELEIQAPVGTKAVYIAPKAGNPPPGRANYITQMEAILDRDTPCDIVDMYYDDVEEITKVILRVKV